jgi:uracil-DNA glycosylase family 4
MNSSIVQPPPNCSLCPRLLDFRNENRLHYPLFHNAPVPSFGSLEASLLVVGLAPGLKGANQTGRPFTGDYAGDLLYSTLLKQGLAEGKYDRRADDGFELRGVRVTNAVRCVPPKNKPVPLEIKTCLSFLESEISAMHSLRAILSLGQIAHYSVASTLGLRRKDHPFGHGARTTHGDLVLLSSYHCSRYNTNTRVLTQTMFDDVISQAKSAAGL